jgi:pleckstrin homology domain-containing family H
VISKWETALREKGSGKFENSRVIRLSYRNRLYFRHAARTETDKERLLLCYQINQQGTDFRVIEFDTSSVLHFYFTVVAGRFPVTRELSTELGALMAQLEIGDCQIDKAVGLVDRFYPYRYRTGLTVEQTR